MTLPKHAPGSRWCECAACGQGFGGVTTFDLHRVGEHGVRDGTANRRRCLTVKEMLARGWTQNKRGLWGRSVSSTMPSRPVADDRERAAS